MKSLKEYRPLCHHYVDYHDLIGYDLLELPQDAALQPVFKYDGDTVVISDENDFAIVRTSFDQIVLTVNKTELTKYWADYLISIQLHMDTLKEILMKYDEQDDSFNLIEFTNDDSFVYEYEYYVEFNDVKTTKEAIDLSQKFISELKLNVEQVILKKIALELLPKRFEHWFDKSKKIIS